MNWCILNTQPVEYQMKRGKYNRTYKTFITHKKLQKFASQNDTEAKNAGKCADTENML